MSYRNRVDGFLHRIGLRVENCPTAEQTGRAPESNARSLGEAPPDKLGHWNIDWSNENDPLRKAILGKGPKRPFGK